MSDKNIPVSRVFTQVSLFRLLRCWCCSGVTGVAEMDRLDGEMLMLDGGGAQFLSGNEGVHFGAIGDFHADASLCLQELPTCESFEKEADGLFPDKNLPLAIHCKGVFFSMKTRCIERLERDGIGLVDLAGRKHLGKDGYGEGTCRLPVAGISVGYQCSGIAFH